MSGNGNGAGAENGNGGAQQTRGIEELARAIVSAAASTPVVTKATGVTSGISMAGVVALVMIVYPLTQKVVTQDGLRSVEKSLTTRIDGIESRLDRQETAQRAQGQDIAEMKAVLKYLEAVAQKGEK